MSRALPPRRFVALLLAPVLLSVASSSLGLLVVPSTRTTGAAAAFFVRTAAPAPEREGRGGRRWTTDRSTSRGGGRRSLSTALVTTSTTTAEGPSTEAATVVAGANFETTVSASDEWRRLAGFSPPQADDPDGARHHEAAETIKRLQQQARIVADKHVISTTSTGAGAGSTSSRGIHLKKELVTSVFSKPAVTHRRRHSSGQRFSEGEHYRRDLFMTLSSTHAAPTAAQSLTIEAQTERPLTKRRGPSTLESSQSESSPKNVEGLPEDPESRPSAHVMAATSANEGETTVFVDVAGSTRIAGTTFSARGEGPAAAKATARADEPVRETWKSPSTLPKSASPRAAKAALSDRVRRLRSQPKSPMVESLLQARYAAITDVGMRAYQILCDLEMVVPTPHPNDPNYDASHDDIEPAPENHYVR